jgi:PKD repeat protein
LPVEHNTVEIISNSIEGVAPATFEFQANVTGGTEPYTYSWNFGDDSEEESDEESVVHTFDGAGMYNVTLTATDTDDQTASDSIEIQVEEGAEIDKEDKAIQEQAVEESEADQSNRRNENNAKAANSTSQ